MDHERYMRRAIEVARGNPDASFANGDGAEAGQRRLEAERDALYEEMVRRMGG